jgi:large subunit ribosomal protein L31e
MTLYTINLSRARSKGRNKRAKKASSLLREELERQEGEAISVSNEVNQKIWSRGASKPPRKIDVEVVESDDGLWAVLSDKKQLSDTSEDESEEDSDEQEYTESDYEEALEGKVSEAQEAIEDFEDPNYDKLIQLEEDGKNRKTLLDFLESQQ